MVEVTQKRRAVESPSQSWTNRLDFTRIPIHVWVIAVVLLLVPTFTSDFTQHQIFWAFILGMISAFIYIGGMWAWLVGTNDCCGCCSYATAFFGAVTEISLLGHG